ncbi:GNAT family N-acetyltransferase [Pedobacter montanisoli]|uniref:GNAT family N-acetyltransferase n=1 Tax=Pedobacter montanisoli TaxID=2923277 RepID=A0ABS9ZYF4_9SPHI|nr:GNAT family N-acetyltransferase [Pedobacter montanisoli]MCJ0743317.1 GNAT family N-acetyltransferase [Pedobacter montanisoli]
MIENLDLKIIMLSFHQLSAYIEPGKLENELGLKLNNRVVSEKVKAKITTQILPEIKEGKAENVFFTFWIIIDKQKNEIAAEFCFKGLPVNQKAEIGYTTFPQFQNRGIMTQALQEISKWIFEYTDLNAILAQTSPQNLASIKVLEKSSFKLIKAEPENMIWERTR